MDGGRQTAWDSDLDSVSPGDVCDDETSTARLMDTSCQCGVSRSATLTIAYTMALAAAGAMPQHLGHIRVMQDAYDFVKGKSCWIGPNHS